MSESMDRSRQATSGWRRTSIAAFSALFAFILARVVLRRRPSQKLDNKISGTIWMDDVSLVPVAESAALR